MAYNDLFDEINNCLGVASHFVFRATAAIGAGPTALWAAAGMQVSITIYDVLIIGLGSAGADTMTIQTAIAPGGMADLSSAIVIAAAGTMGRTATIVAAQAVAGPADAAQVVHSAATVGGVVHLLAYLT